MSGFFRRADNLERRLRTERPAPRAELMESLTQRIESTPFRRRSGFRLGLAATVTAVMVVSLAVFGGLGYAATSVSHAVKTAVHVVAPAKHHAAAKQAGFNSAAAQYGKKVSICTVEPNGKQHTITISQNAEASYLRTHPRAYPGSCGAFRPKGAKANVCVTKTGGGFAPVFVPASKQNAYLKRNANSHTTKTGKC